MERVPIFGASPGEAFLEHPVSLGGGIKPPSESPLLD